MDVRVIALAPVLRLAAIAGVVWSACVAAQSSGSLAIGGNVANPATLSVADLRRLPSHDVRYAPRRRGEAAEPRNYTGCLLRDVLDAAKPVEAHARDLRRSYVVATARDGYTVVFSWPELYASSIGEGVYVVYERDGKALGDDEGPIALVSVADTSSMRHVKWLTGMALQRAQ